MIIMSKKIKKISNLCEICDWSQLKNVAIEHYFHDNETKIINYRNVYKAQRALKIIINDNIKSETQEFIGIHYSTPIYCIPALILGIISAQHAFVFLSPDQLTYLIQTLNIKFIFHPKNINLHNHQTKTLKKFVMHKEPLKFSSITNFMENTKINLWENDLYKINDEIRSKENGLNNCQFAYAITTSGSTGQPVPVKVTHSSLLSNILDFKELFNLSSNDKIAQLTLLTFDPSLIELFLNFAAGSTLVTFSEELKNDPSALLNILHHKKITFMSTTPSLLLHRGWTFNDIKSTILGENSNLKFLLLGGEVFPNHNIISKIKSTSNCTRIFNVYGITEVSCWASIKEIIFDYNTNNDQFQPDLGTVLSDTFFEIRDAEDGHVINEDNCEGLLYIGSNSRICVIGKEKIEELELPVFRNSGDLVIKNKFGQILIKGRQDSCIKRFGSKIFLNDLNFHVQKLHFVEACYSMIYRPSNKLYLFVKSSNDSSNVTEIWTHIKKLPSKNLHPDVVHFLENFQMTTNGKICLKHLENICYSLESNLINSNMDLQNMEDLLKQSWLNHLQCEPHAIHSSRFLDSGGTSIIALQIYSELLDKSNHNFTRLVGMLLENKTLEECLNYVRTCGSNEPENIRENTSVGNRANLNLLFNANKDKSVWQKFRGRTKVISDDSRTEKTDEYSLIWNDVEVDDYHTYNLGKCVDASPTVFGYDLLNESAFVCVGSHSGKICTVKLSHNKPSDDEKWEISLPNNNGDIKPRIEAPILLVEDFKGIVGCHDGNIYCVHLKTGEVFWRFSTGNIVKCTATICSKKENIFVGSYDHFFYCISIKDGSLVWKREIYSSICSTPHVHDKTNNVIIGLLNGTCYCLSQTSGEIKWEYQLPSPIFSSPVVLHHNVIIFADVCGHIIGLDLDLSTAINHEEQNKKDNSSPQFLWEFSISGHIFSDLVLHIDSSDIQNLIFASKNGFIYRYYFSELKSIPQLKYKVSCNSTIVSTPWVNDNVIVIAQEEGAIKLIDYQKGCFLHTIFNLHGDCFSSPVLHKNFIVVGSRDDQLYIICLKNKTENRNKE